MKKSYKASFCEWKGQAAYYTIEVNEKKAKNAAWFYPNPAEPFSLIKDFVAIYAEEMDDCFVDGEQVKPQPGNFYGGWITSDIVGPFKGIEGSMGW